MPNNGRITLCPYYRDEKNLSISCEDVFRRFRWPAQKKRWLDAYCDKDWRDCPHAKELSGLYEKLEEDMSDTGKIVLEQKHKIAALEKELRKTASMLGRAESREKKKDADIKQLRHEKNVLEQLYIKNKNLYNESRENEKKLTATFNELVGFYEKRFAYLIIRIGGFLGEAGFKKWAETHVPEIVPRFGEEKELLGYEARGKEIDDEHKSGRAAAEAEETGGNENESSER